MYTTISHSVSEVEKCFFVPETKIMYHFFQGNILKASKLIKKAVLTWYIVFVGLKLPSPITGPCEYFPIACIVSQIFFLVLFFSI